MGQCDFDFDLKSIAYCNVRKPILLFPLIVKRSGVEEIVFASKIQGPEKNQDFLREKNFLKYILHKGHLT